MSSRPSRDRKSHAVCNSCAAIAQDDEEDEDDYVPEGYYPDDDATASNIDAARTHVSETQLEQGSQQQGNGVPPADQVNAADDGPGEASSPELSDEQVRTFLGRLKTSKSLGCLKTSSPDRAGQ